jgi:hypothetical protein
MHTMLYSALNVANLPAPVKPMEAILLVPPAVPLSLRPSLFTLAGGTML